ncbi:MAG: hypothetical protein V1774_01015 [Candidatus Eisenbacteria bacterium]
MHLTEDDFGSTYGNLNAWDIRLAIPIQAGMEAVLNAAWAHGHGDPYYNLRGFNADDGAESPAELTMVPLEFGILFHDRSCARHRVNVGLLFQEIWAREKIYQGPQTPESFSGWGWGGRFLIGPEWFLGGSRYSLGFDLSMTVSSVDVRAGNQVRTVHPTGPELHVYAARRF